jgi:ParB family chromosome partitioning protein
MTKIGHTQDRVAQAVGKSRSHVANIVRLLSLPETVKVYLREGKLTAGHARTLVTADDPVAMARLMVEGGLNVREAEAFTNKKKGKGKSKAAKKDANTAALEREMTNVLGMPVMITTKGKGGSIAINYASLDQLDEVLKRLSQNPGRARA